MNAKPGFWRKCRIALRWCRIATVLAVFALVCAVVWLNRVGLPDFLKRPLVLTLRERGVALEFSRLRLRISRGLVADNVRIGQADAEGSPVFTSTEIELPLDLNALLHRRLQVIGLVVSQGKLVLPFAPGNAMVWTNIQADVHFQTNDTWSLNDFKADCGDVKMAANGSIAHAPDLQKWKIFHAPKTGGPPQWPAQLKKISDTLGRIHFIGAPRLTLAVNGDARNVKTFRLRLNAQIPGADTPWGELQQAVLDANARPRDLDSLPALHLQLAVDRAETLWGSLHSGTLNIQAAAAPLLQFPPAAVRLAAVDADTRWGGAREIQFAATLAATDATNADAAWGWWTNLQPYRLDWTARLQELKSEKLNADSIVAGGFWRAPELSVTNLAAGLGGGSLAAAARLNVATRELAFTNSSDFDLHAVAELLTDKTRERLDEFVWTQPPVLKATGSLVFPAWTNSQPDWRAEVQPSVRLDGELAFTNGLVLGAQIDSARTHFSYNSLIWNLPDLEITQAKTKLALSGSESDATKNYVWQISGAFDPAAIRPFLTASNAVRGFGHLQFTGPVIFRAHVTGRLYDYDLLSADGWLACTNFALRTQHVDSVTGDFSYTNHVLEFFNPRLWRAGGAQTMTADQIVLDFDRKLISFTNGFSTAEPEVVARAIGPKTGRLLEPYQFLEPPTVRVHGCVPLRDINGGRDADDADMSFEIVRGVPFRWAKLNTTNILGTIRWVRQFLILSNVTAKVYGGTGGGGARFDFRPATHDADYQFAFAVTNISLRLLAGDLAAAKNRLEGVLTGELAVTNASTVTLQSWNGYGHVKLRDGMLWDVPIFGIFSPVLNTISPGLGNSQAKEASAKFVITNGVIATDSLEIRSTMARLNYSGTADLKGKLNARVTAQPLRDAWVIGPLVSPLFWPVSKVFEYKVTGTLQHPKSEPVLTCSKKFYDAAAPHPHLRIAAAAGQ